MKKYIYIIFTALIGFTSCLDKEPLSQMSPETFFSNENELQAFSNPFYTVFPSTTLYSENVDNVIRLELSEEVRGARIVPASGGGWTWSILRDINTMLGHIDNCKDEQVREQYEGLARFFRAYFYFEKVKMFGDVPWYDKELASDDPDLYKPRDSREFVMQNILDDLDYAIEKLPSTKSLYTITKWTALALKSRACLFEGTFRKYHNINLEGKDWQWYLQECADASYDFIAGSGYSLYKTGGTNSAYRNLFINADKATEEVILARDYNKSLGIFHDSNYSTMSASYGRPGLTRKIVASYLMKDGTRFTDKAGWEEMGFVEETKNRDPRLAQTIRTSGYTRYGKTALVAPDFSTCITGYHPTKYVGGTEHDGYNKSYLDLIIFRSAEVYLNYAEAKAELGSLKQNDLDISVNKLRQRVGMPNLDMDAANDAPDAFLQSAQTGYVNVTGDNLGVILEIRRERTIELLGEGHRYFDMVRWKEGKAFEQPLLGMYFPGPGEYDLNEDGVNDVHLYKGKTPTASTSKVLLQIGQDILLTDGDKGCVFPHKGNTGRWNESRDYLYPIPTDDRSLTFGALTQNPGWNDGLDF